jgi:hypothetical protein
LTRKGSSRIGENKGRRILQIINDLIGVYNTRGGSVNNENQKEV